MVQPAPEICFVRTHTHTLSMSFQPHWLKHYKHLAVSFFKAQIALIKRRSTVGKCILVFTVAKEQPLGRREFTDSV